MTSNRESRDDNYFIPMTDLLIGVLFIFIIIIMAIMLNLNDLENSTRDELEKNASLSSQLGNLSLINSELKKKIEELYIILQDKTSKITDLEKESIGLKQVMEADKKKYLENIIIIQGKINKFLAVSTSIKQELLRSIQAKMKYYGYPTTVDEANGILRLPDNVLFQSGEYIVTESGERVLDVLASVLEELLPQYTWQRKNGATFCPREACLEAIYVEGHTDKRPVQRNLKGGIRTNLELSSARAIMTYQSFARHENLMDFINGRGEKLLGVCGYGESRPVNTGNRAEDLSANRRIDLRFLMEAPKLTAQNLIEEVLR